MKQLYEVEARWYVLAEDKQEAESIQPRWGMYSVEVCEASSIDNDWADSLPFGEDDKGDRTCKEILEADGD